MTCPKCLTPLGELNTPEGVLVDFCPSCKGCWYDKGELLFASQYPVNLKLLIEGPLLSPRASDFRCPRCRGALEEGGLGAPDLVVGRCVSCRGFWLETGQRVRLDQITARGGRRSFEGDASSGPPDIVVYLSKRKRLGIMLVALGFAAVGLLMVVYPEEVDLPVWLAVLVGVNTASFGALGFLAIFRGLLLPSKPYIIVNHEGIGLVVWKGFWKGILNPALTRNETLLIKWEDVVSISTRTFCGRS
jgi:Zn-finger nucleic acid-binding protein